MKQSNWFERRFLVLFAAWMFAPAAVMAEDFWEKKAYADWNDAEIRKLITYSPWSKDVTVTAPASALGGPPRGAQPGVNDVETGGGGGGGRGRRGGGGGGRGAGGSQALITLNISWRSALPLKQALVKSRMASGAGVPQELQQGLAREEPHYVIVVSGLPAQMARTVQNLELLKQSVLRRGTKQPINLAGVDFQPRTQSVDIIFAFSKTDPITADDKDIEVVLKLGQIEAKKKFNLKDMVYKGKLEL